MNDLLSSDPDPDWERIRPILDDVICQLGGRDRDAVLMRYFKGMPFVEIGNALRVTEETARQRVKRALDKMHALLARRGITSTTAAIAIMLANQGAIAAPAGLVLKIASGALIAPLAGGGFPLGNSLNFMTTSKSVVSLATIAALLGIGSALYEANVANGYSEQLTRTSAETVNLQRQIESTNRSLKALQNGGASSISAGTANGPQNIGVQIGKRTSSPLSPEVEKVLDHPELRKLYLQGVALKAKVNFGAFFSSAGLSSAQLDAFAKLVTARESANLDLFASLRSQSMLDPSGMTHEGAEGAQSLITQEAGKIAADFSQGMNDLLGPDTNAQLRQYAATIGDRNVVSQFAGQLELSNTPLTQPQEVRLTQILAQQGLDWSGINSAPTGNVPAILSAVSGTVAGVTLDKVDAVVIADSIQQSGSNSLITDAAIAKAQEILNPQQITALQAYQLQQVIQIKLAPTPTHR